jgi:peptidoglycan-associated lipoprotein
MILVRRGLHAWSDCTLRKEKQEKMRSFSVWRWWFIGVVLIALAASGCPKKTPPPSETIPGGLGPSGMGESGLPPAGVPGETTQRQIDYGPERGGPLQDVYFAYDSFDLTPESRETLRSNANWLQSNAQARVEVEGHCDERGTTEYNLALGAKRARAARDYLVTLGVSPERLSTISYGEELPLCREATESCWQQNRRVHFLVLNR